MQPSPKTQCEKERKRKEQNPSLETQWKDMEKKEKNATKPKNPMWKGKKKKCNQT